MWATTQTRPRVVGIGDSVDVKKHRARYVRDQIIVRPHEIGHVGEHRQTGRAARFIGLGMGGRIEVGADQALGWGRLLDLGNQREAPRGFGLQRPAETARGRLLSRGGVEIGDAARGLARGDMVGLGFEDLGEAVRHGYFFFVTPDLFRGPPSGTIRG